MKALLSVSDKSGIVAFAKELCAFGYEILSTGGTLAALREAEISATDVGDYTGSGELFGGRVKTLHPKIHGGILFRREQDAEVAEEHGIEPIDLVCVNLYPFAATVQSTNDWDTIIENIDIGGPALIRAAAKNFADVIVLTSPNDYATALDVLKNGGNTLDFRRGLMQKAFEHTAAYDAMIANYMNMRIDNNFGATHFITAHKVCATSYGENPHQRGALYETGAFWGNIATLKGAPSFNNYADLNQALKIATNFGARPAVAIVKHGNPCGFALRDTLAESYKAALACDPISAYGGVAAINGILDEPLARLMNEHYLEVIIAAQITPEAQDVFAAKKRIKLFATNSDALQIPHDSINFKHIEGGFLLQQADRVSEAEIANMQCKSARTASKRELEDLAIAYKIAALTKSNCIVYVKDRAMVAIGMGMTSRVDAALAALRKADELKIDMHGAVCASEAFFPFRDSIDSAASAGITAVIQPGGSIRDKEVIEAANEHKIALYFTGTRHFYH